MNISDVDNSHGSLHTNIYGGLRSAKNESPSTSFSNYLEEVNTSQEIIEKSISDKKSDNSSHSSLTTSDEYHHKKYSQEDQVGEPHDKIQITMSEESSSTEIYVDDSGVIHNNSGTQFQSLPDGIGWRGAEAIKYLENQGSKIIFNFSEDGSISIKDGLSRSDYLRAKQILKEWGQPHREGLGLPPFEDWRQAKPKTTKTT